MTAARASTSTAPDRGRAPRPLLLTVLGELVLPRGGAVWTSTVVRALGALDVEERNARQALARLADDGTLSSERHGRRARWHLTDRGQRLLVDGTRRIYGLGTDDDAWDGRWLVVLCSVPEEQRAKRHRLRTRLEFAGFGFLAPGVAVSPHLEREDDANDVLARARPRRRARWCSGPRPGRWSPPTTSSPGPGTSTPWPRPTRASRPPSWPGRHGPTRTASPASSSWSTRWRRFPFADPGIPPALLPPRWPGHRAHDVFVDRHDAWTPGARRWYEALEGAAVSPVDPTYMTHLLDVARHDL